MSLGRSVGSQPTDLTLSGPRLSGARAPPEGSSERSPGASRVARTVTLGPARGVPSGHLFLNTLVSFLNPKQTWEDLETRKYEYSFTVPKYFLKAYLFFLRERKRERERERIPSRLQALCCQPRA